MKPAQIFVQGDLTWDQLQMLISKSTTADLLKIINKLEEFFSQQFKSSKKLFSSLEPWDKEIALNSNKNASGNIKKNSEISSGINVSHHRHWQRALQKISGIPINSFQSFSKCLEYNTPFSLLFKAWKFTLYHSSYQRLDLSWVVYWSLEEVIFHWPVFME